MRWIGSDAMPGSEYLEAAALGVIQGLAEFLPVSSSGHLVIFGELIHSLTGQHVDPRSSLHLNVALHLGTLLAILWIYRRDLRVLANRRRVCLAIVVATLPLVVVGLSPWEERLTSLFGTPVVAGWCLLVTAALLLVGQWLERRRYALDELPIPAALTIGLFQLAALLPGISRSGSTIVGGMLTGLHRESAAAFSFFIAIPAIAGAATLTAKDAWSHSGGGYSMGAILFGTVISFGVGLAALRWLLRLVSQRKLHWFAVYCTLVGTATIFWQSL